MIILISTSNSNLKIQFMPTNLPNLKNPKIHNPNCVIRNKNQYENFHHYSNLRNNYYK